MWRVDGGWATGKWVQTYSLSEGHCSVPGARDGPEQTVAERLWREAKITEIRK